MVNGRKSIFSLGSEDAVAATKTIVSPSVTVTDPLACPANLPVSIEILRPAISQSTLFNVEMENLPLEFRTKKGKHPSGGCYLRSPSLLTIVVYRLTSSLLR